MRCSGSHCLAGELLVGRSSGGSLHSAALLVASLSLALATALFVALAYFSNNLKPDAGAFFKDPRSKPVKVCENQRLYFS
jgi:hypothetical protein